MAFMVAYPNDEAVRQFRCTHCDWTFHVQKPLTSEVPLELQKGYAERWYAGHRCSGLMTAQDSSTCFVASQRVLLETAIAEG